MWLSRPHVRFISQLTRCNMNFNCWIPSRTASLSALALMAGFCHSALIWVILEMKCVSSLALWRNCYIVMSDVLIILLLLEAWFGYFDARHTAQWSDPVWLRRGLVINISNLVAIHQDNALVSHLRCCEWYYSRWRKFDGRYSNELAVSRHVKLRRVSDLQTL